MARNGLFPKSVQPGIPRLGKLPKGWQSFLLGDLVKEVSRPASLVDDEEYLQVTAKRSRGGIVSRGSQRGKKIKTKTQFYVEPGDFLISRRQIVHGGCGIVPDALNGAIVSNEYLVLHSNGKILQDYLQWLSHSIYFQQTCFHASIGVHVEKMVFKPEWWFKFKFQIPPVEEQKRIAEILNTWDTAITQTEQLIAAKQKLKKGLMQQLLTGKKRLIPHKRKNWIHKTLCDLANIYQPQTISQAELSESGYPVYGANGFIGYYYQYNHESWQITITCRGSTCGTVNKTPPESWITGNSMVINSDGVEGIDKQFLYHLLSNCDFRNLVEGSGQPQITRKPLASFLICFPECLDEQREITATLDAIYNEIISLNTLVQKLKEQKRGLMQKLLMGQIRVGKKENPK